MHADTESRHPPCPPRWLASVAAGALVVLVGFVFHPIFEFEFVDLDVPEQVIDNQYVHGLSFRNLEHILTSRCSKSYYPLRALTFAVDYQIWGLNPRGFKLTNLLVHLANVVLVCWLILRLFRRSGVPETSAAIWWDVYLAAFGAAFFAVHPLVVEPVAWVSGREELLMTLGALGSIHFHLTARNLEGRRAGLGTTFACHAGTTFCCAAACLSNAVGAVIPFLITLYDLLMVPRPRAKKILCATAPLWGIAAATIAIKISGDVHNTAGAPASLSLTWLMLVLNIFWLNLTSLVWPTDLAVHYAWPAPRSLLDGQVILGTIALMLLSLLLGLLWQRKQYLLLLGLCWFGLALGPVSAILPHHICRADRFLYLPLAGVAIALAASLRPCGTSLLRSRILASAAVLLVLAEACLSTAQLPTWQNSLTLWENALNVDPDNSFAHACLARSFAARKQFEQSIAHYEEVLRRPPVQPKSLADFACVLATCDARELRDYRRASQLVEWACTATAWKDREVLQIFAKVHSSFAEDLAARGQIEEAIRHYSMSIEADPGFDVPLFNLALLLLTSSDKRFQQPDVAVQLAQRGCRLTVPPDPQRLAILAVAYSQVHRFDEAVASACQALKLAGDAGDQELAQEIEYQLGLYRNKTAFLPSLE